MKRLGVEIERGIFERAPFWTATVTATDAAELIALLEQNGLEIYVEGGGQWTPSPESKRDLTMTSIRRAVKHRHPADSGAIRPQWSLLWRSW
jgi:hypothetical protein